MEHEVGQGKGVSAQALDSMRVSQASFRASATYRDGQQSLAKAAVSLLQAND